MSIAVNSNTSTDDSILAYFGDAATCLGPLAIGSLIQSYKRD